MIEESKISEKTDIGVSTRWDLSVFYSGIEDPQLKADLIEFEKKAGEFKAKYQGKLGASLGAAISDYSYLDMLGNKIGAYLFLLQSLNVSEPAVKARMAEVDRIMSYIQGEYLTFFHLELVKIDESSLAELYASDETVKKHRPWIEQLRLFKKNLLEEQVESALAKRSPFGAGAWSEFFDELESDLRFEYGGASKTLTEMLDTLSNSKDKAERALVMKTINQGFEGGFAKYSAQTLYMVAGRDAVERRERGYKHPMEAQNKSNMIPDDVVDALHRAVISTAAPLAQKYYRIKARLLGFERLAWSDRNAPLPFVDESKVPFDKAMETVLEAYSSFSPRLAEIIKGFKAEGRIDAPAAAGKRGGAYNFSMVLPGDRPVSFTFLNYLGSDRDVMTLAHELGHGVHGILAGQSQGSLMFHAPIAYCETASVFGEMTAFNFLRSSLKGDSNKSLSLLAGKIEDILNTVVRQIGFSNFEKRLHGMDAEYKKWGEVRKMSAEELDAVWLKTLEEMYGKPGDVFTYENAEHLWAYVSHFHRPFYVYGYAFGELLTQSLYAQKDRLGDDFEKLYIDMLSSGGTRDVVELMSPFGLDPRRETFWEDGIRLSLGSMIDELGDLAGK